MGNVQIRAYKLSGLGLFAADFSSRFGFINDSNLQVIGGDLSERLKTVPFGGQSTDQAVSAFYFFGK